MPSLVGREPELATIDRFLRSMPEGYRAVVFRGGAGYGKSALLDELITQGHDLGMRVLSARPAETEAELPFGVLSELLEPVVETSELDLPGPQTRALEIALRRIDPDDERPLDPLALGLAVLGAIRELATRAPVLVAVDDLQWSDPPSSRALGFALRRLQGRSVGLAAAIRSGADADVGLAVPADRIETVEVGPLDEPAFGVVVRRAAGTALARPLIRRLHVACDGNALFGSEIATLLAERAPPSDPTAPLPVPPSASAAIGARLRALEPGTRNVLLAAAALPRPAVRVLAAAYGEEVAEGALTEAAAAGVVSVEGDLLRFSHPLVAAAVYGAATPSKRRAAHARIARALDGAEERAPHLALAATRPSAPIAAEVEAAAAAARARGAPDTAGRLLEQAVAVTPARDAPAGRRRLLEAARCHFVAGDTGRARTLLGDLVSMAAPGEELGNVLLELARATEDDLEHCVAHAYAALGQARDNPALEVRIRHYLIDLHFGAGEAERAAEQAQAALATAEAIGDQGSIATAIARVANADFFRGRPVRLDELERAVAIDRRLGGWARVAADRPIVALADYLKRVGDYDRSRELHLEQLRTAAELGDEHERASVLVGLADIENRAGNLSLAGAYGAEIAELGEQLDDLALRAYGLLRSGTTHALHGDRREGASVTGAGREVAVATSTEPWIAWADHTLGVLALEAGDAEAALALFDDVERRLDAAGILDPAFRQLPTGIEALIALGRLDEAETRIAAYERRCSTERHARSLALTARYRALLASLRGEHEEAEAVFAQSLELQARAPSPYDQARTLLALATARRRRRRRGDARTALEEAIVCFERAGALNWAARARSDLAALGLRRGPADQLTPMEDRVARAVAEGATNREAAASLFLSERTIEFHLRSVYRKLHLRSRTELAAELGRRAASQLAAAGDTIGSAAV